MRIQFVTIAALGLLTPGAVIAAAPDPTGKQEFGIEITQAGTTSGENQAFVMKLPADQQANILNTCIEIVATPENHAPQVITFCNNVKPIQSAQNTTNAPAATTAAPANPSSELFATVPSDAMLSYNLIGLNIYSPSNENVGEIKDLVIEKGRLAGYIISVGGFLGLGERYVVINPAALNVSYDEANAKWRATLSATKDQLQNAPEFKYEGKFKR